MKVLLVSPNREHLPDPVFPLGLAYIAAAVKRSGHEVKVADLCFSDDIDRDIRESVNGFPPDIVGVSLRNIDDVAYPKKHSYLKEYRDAIEIIRKFTSAPVVLGGSGFTIMPEQFMKELHADYGIAGEGEKAFPELIERIGLGNIVEDTRFVMSRICFGASFLEERFPTGGNDDLKVFSRRNNISRFIYSSRTRIKNIDDTLPERVSFDCESYYRLGGMLNIQTKRGCPFRCIYCTYPMIEGRTVRIRSPLSVADEIETIIENTGVRHLFIVDSTFNYPVSHAMAVCDEIIKRRLDIKWSCYANPRHMTERLAGAMAKAGCTGIEFGTDSLTDEGLSIMGKDFNYEKVKKASVICRKNGIKFCHFIFAGSPGDNEETVKTNIDRLDELNPDAAVIMAGIRIFPGTRLAEIAKEDLGISDIGLKPVFYMSKNVSKKIDSIAEIVSGNRNWVMPGYEINIYPRLQKRLRERGIKGSLWEELSKR